MTHDASGGARVLELGVGSWVGEERMPPSDMTPDGVVAEARSEARLLAGGTALVTEYRQLMDGEVTLHGVSVTVWDVAEDRYVMYWFDPSGSAPTAFAGGFEDGVLTLVGPGPEGSRIRHRTDYPDDDTMHTVSHIRFEGHDWMHVFEGTYRRSTG